MNREPGNRSKTANCPNFAAELDSQWKYNKKKPEKHTVWGQETMTWLSNAVPILLLVKTDNLVDRKAKSSLILPPPFLLSFLPSLPNKSTNQPTNPPKTQQMNPKAKSEPKPEGNSLNSCSPYHHDGLRRLRADFSLKQNIGQHCCSWWLSLGHPEWG